MTTAPLCACGQPSPSAALCKACSRQLAAALRFAAAIAADLDDAVARLLRRGSGVRARGHEQPLPLDLAASDAAAQLRIVLRRRVRVIAETYTVPLPADSVGGMARWLEANMNLVRRHEAAQDVMDEVTAAVERAVRVLDWRPAERLYAGPCPHCGADLLGQRGAAVITCRCGMVTEVAAAHDAMRAQLEDRLGSVSWCASMATALGIRLTENTVKSWAHRERLVAHGTLVSAASGREYAVYRFGDVLDLAALRVRVKGLAPWTSRR